MKLLIRLGFILLLSWIFYLIPNKFMPYDFFKIKKIRIEGSTKILLSELTELAKTTYNSNIWEIDIKGIEDYLKKDVRIKDVDIKTPFLGELIIKIEEKKAEYYVQLNNNIYLLDEEGIILGFLKENSEKDTYFILAKDENEIREILKISRLIDNLLLKNLVSQIYIKDKDCINLVLVDRTVIKTNLDVDKEKYKVLETLYNELIKTKKIEYIDIRFDDFIVKSLGDKNNDK